MTTIPRLDRICFVIVILLAACGSRSRQIAHQPADDEVAAIILLENTTPQQVTVYFIDHALHVRLGAVAPKSHARIPVRKALVRQRSAFRIYAFRGLDACPVARVLNISVSRTPRVTVSVADTTSTGYTPGDGCLKQKS